MTAELPATPAATLVLFRDRHDAPPELLMVERALGMAFAAGALVFPGGRVDEGDHRLAADRSLAGDHGLDSDEAAARVAAIRETIEESGIAAGFALPPANADIERIRDGLARGRDFAALLRQAAAALDLHALTPFARWRPAFKHARIFDTRFYIAHVPENAPEPVVDATENVRVFWASAAQVLECCDRGDAHVIFPTRRNLERLAALASFGAASEHAAAHAVEIITPWVEERDGAPHICIPEGLGYPVTSEPLSSASRA